VVKIRPEAERKLRAGFGRRVDEQPALGAFPFLFGAWHGAGSGRELIVLVPRAVGGRELGAARRGPDGQPEQRRPARGRQPAGGLGADPGLEAQTGVVLVRRTPRGSSLTAEGAVIAEWAARLLDVAAELDAGIAALRADRRSRLRVISSSTIAEQVLPAWLASFRAAAERPGRPAPDVVLTAANSETVIAAITEGTADLGFIEGPRRPTGLRSRVIGHDRLAVIAAPGHPWTRRRRGITAAELAGTPLVSREGGSGTRDTLATALATALGAGPARAPAALSLSTTAAVRAAVLAGAAPAVISELAVADDLAAGRLVEIPVPGLDLRRTLRVIWAGPEDPPAGAARDLITHILSRRVPGRMSARSPGADR
jgi:DNA-binding transcriptional LysR family regulator